MKKRKRANSPFVTINEEDLLWQPNLACRMYTCSAISEFLDGLNINVLLILTIKRHVF